jgi:tetratricopeptide (TPR) repeat protein
MRITVQMAVLLSVLAVFPCRASYDTMPVPPPDAPTGKSKTEEDKGRAKRGVHWYRSPQCETSEKQMALAEKYAKAKRLHKAANAYQALVYAWPDSPEAPKAQLALAEVQEQRELYAKAFNEYQYMFDYYPGQFDYRDLLDRQFKIANYLMVTPKGAWLFFHGFQAPERALPMFEKSYAMRPPGPVPPRPSSISGSSMR